MAGNQQKQSERNIKVPGNYFLRLCKKIFYSVYFAIAFMVWDGGCNYFNKPPNFDFKEMKKRSGQVVVMTGGGRGIGYEIVRKLLMLDYTIILGVRSFSSAENGIEEIRKSGVLTGKVVFFSLDLASLKSVKNFANSVLSSDDGSRIDLLINNAGISSYQYELTVDGYENIFQVNYLSHFFLTNLLLPRITKTAKVKAAPCHIINTSSTLHLGANVSISEFENSKIHCGPKRYADSKLSQLMSVLHLQQKLDEENAQVYVYACHPGLIFTDILHENPAAELIMKICNAFWTMRTADEAANVVLSTVLTPEFAENRGGLYFESGIVYKYNPQADDVQLRSRIWKKSLELTKCA